MAALTAALLASAAVGASIFANKQVSDIKQGKEDAKNASEAQVREAGKLADAAESRRKNEEGLATEAAAQSSARSRQKAIAAASQGRRSTILTGPLGVVGEAETARKTILGL